MKIKRINLGWSSMTGMGPAAWNRDHHILNMHISHHEKYHHPERGDKGGKTATDQDDSSMRFKHAKKQGSLPK